MGERGIVNSGLVAYTIEKEWIVCSGATGRELVYFGGNHSVCCCASVKAVAKFNR